MQDQQDLLAHRGIALARRVLRRLDEVGIFAQSSVSLEHQHLAGRYVVRGIESGGAVKDIGRYVAVISSGSDLPTANHETSTRKGRKWQTASS